MNEGIRSRYYDTYYYYAVDNDSALYEEYQNLQSQRDDSVYDMNETMSFEDWKLKKKQFKQGM